MKKKLKIFIIITGAVIFLYASVGTKTYLGRYIKWRNSDIEDYKKFPGYEFKASANPFYFFKKTIDEIGTLRLTQRENHKDELLRILKNSGTTAFLVIRDDTILFEKYLNGYRRQSVNTSFSIAKSITSLTTGKAIDEHLIRSVNDPVTRYIPELLQTDPGYKNLVISDLLDMRSGIRFVDHDLPWGDKPKAYYHPYLRQRILELPLENNPGSTFKYNSYNPILVGMILEKATGLPPARYFEKKIWDKLGMEFSGSWSMDSKKSGMTKMESGLNLRAIDLAKFGRLILNQGNWDGDQIISTDWLNYSFSISEKYKLPAFSSDLFYRNFWWIYADEGATGYDVNAIAATGHLGQYLFIFPKENIIIVRMGKKNVKVGSWRKIFEEIVRYATQGR